MGKVDAVTNMGSTANASMLHVVNILLRVSTYCDWLIILIALDCPLITQDGRFLDNFYSTNFVSIMFGKINTYIVEKRCNCGYSFCCE